MKFLLDVCVTSRSLEAFLEEAGHDVLRAAAIDPGASDEHLLALAFDQGRVLVTADKDFGEVVFVRNMLHGPVVRLAALTVDEQLEGMDELLAWHADVLTGPVIVTLTRRRIRIRRLDVGG